jgi:hypothetical protein
VSNKRYKPEYIPEVKDVMDISNFDPEYTSMPVEDSLVTDSELRKACAADFRGFTYVADSALQEVEGNMGSTSLHGVKNGSS